MSHMQGRLTWSNVIEFSFKDLSKKICTMSHIKIMSPRKKAHGKGATVSCLIKFLHLSQLICNKYPNPENGEGLEGCLTICQEVKKINCKDQLALVMKHDDFVGMDQEPQELYAVKKHFSIQVEGIRTSFLMFHWCKKMERKNWTNK